MCGRYSVQKKTLLIANSLVKKNINVDLEQDNFNCAPGGKYPCIKSATNGKYLEMTIFGILPSWAKPDFRRLHNARLEGIETKVSFKKLIVNSRAVIPITGFYEWQKVSEKKFLTILLEQTITIFSWREFMTTMGNSQSLRERQQMTKMQEYITDNL